MNSIADLLCGIVFVILFFMIIPKIWNSNARIIDNIIYAGIAAAFIIFIFYLSVKLMIIHWFISSLIIGAFAYVMTKKPELSLTATIMSSVILFIGSFFVDEPKNNSQNYIQQQDQNKRNNKNFFEKIIKKIKNELKEELKEDDDDKNYDRNLNVDKNKNENSKNTEQNNSIEGQLFFTGKDRNFGEDEDKYYLIKHQFTDTLQSCQVIKVSGNTSTKFVYTFYNFYTDEGSADYTKYLAKNDSQNDSHLEEVDKGNISMTVSPVVHALWSQFVEPKVKSSSVSNNKNFSSIPAEYYIGKFNVSGAEGYLLTETLRKTGNTTYEARLKAIFPSGQAQFIDYFIDIGEKSFSNSDGFNGKIDEYRTPIEYGIFRYILGNM